MSQTLSSRTATTRTVASSRRSPLTRTICKRVAAKGSSDFLARLKASLGLLSR